MARSDSYIAVLELTAWCSQHGVRGWVGGYWTMDLVGGYTLAVWDWSSEMRRSDIDKLTKCVYFWVYRCSSVHLHAVCTSVVHRLRI